MDAALARAAWVCMRRAFFVAGAAPRMDAGRRRRGGHVGLGFAGLGVRSFAKKSGVSDDRALRLHAESALPRKFFAWAWIYDRRGTINSGHCFCGDDPGHLSSGDARRSEDSLGIVWRKI